MLWIGLPKCTQHTGSRRLYCRSQPDVRSVGRQSLPQDDSSLEIVTGHPKKSEKLST